MEITLNCLKSGKRKKKKKEKEEEELVHSCKSISKRSNERLEIKYTFILTTCKQALN